MTPDRLEQIERLYNLVLEREPHERTAFLDQACTGDEDLRRHLESLLSADLAAGDLLEGPASDLLVGLTTAPLEAGTQIGPYRVDGLLGTGGMGEVYLALDSRLNRRVAIKLLPERLADDSVARERLRREALAAASLDHPFLCKIFDVGQEGNASYFAMEYVRGETLLAHMRSGRVPLAEALRIAGEIAEALEEAHANHFVHRDLKPGNIMLTEQGHVKVMDFGLAKRIAPEIPVSPSNDDASLSGGAIAGTLQYMSPEQIARGAVDHRTDLFSFGIIFAELLIGKHPFQRDSPLETMAAILRDQPDLSVSGGLGVAPGLLVLIRRLLAKSREDRYPSIREVRADLANLGGTATVVAEAPRLTLVGRETERAALVQALEEALAGHGSMALISGEPGIGKTHLARTLLGEAARRGCFTVTGHCYESEGAPPYIPFVEMLEQAARALPRDTFLHTLGDAAPEVARLMPELRRIFPDIPPALQLPPEQQRRYLYNAYLEFVGRAARSTPFVAVFEDLHWADEPSLLLLQHLLQALASMPVLLIGTYRDVELDTQRPFARTLETLLREKQARRFALRRLPLAGIGELLAALSGRTPPASAAQLVFDHTDGNPFFVEEVFRHLADEDQLFDREGAWRLGLSARLQVPQGVRLVIGRRMERLAEETRRVLTTAAVIGRGFSLRLLEELEGGVQTDAALNAIEQAERLHLVEAETSRHEARYRFVHELVRQTLAGTLSLPRRQRVHARVADAIERIHADQVDAQASVLAHHLYQAGAAADAGKTVLWLTRAAKQAATAAAFEEALAHLDDVLSLIGGEQTARAAEVHAERATVLRSLGRMPEAIDAFQQALTLFKATGEINRFGETSLTLVEIFWWMERLDEAGEICRRGLEALGETETPTRIFLLGASAGIAALANDLDSALPKMGTLAKLPLPPHPGLIATATRFQATLQFICAQLEGAYRSSTEAQRLCESAGDLWGKMDVAWIRAGMALHLGRPAEAVSIAREAIPLSERIGHWGNAFFCEDQVYNGRFAAGDFACATEAAAVLDRYERQHYVPWGIKFKVDLANVARLQGRMDEAVEWCARARIASRNHWGGYAHAALALTLAQAGGPRFSQALEDAMPYVPRAGHPAPYGRWPTLNLVIEALATAGRTDEAAKLLPVAEQMLDLGFAIMWAGHALPRTSAGIAAACAGQWDRAGEHHQAALQQADSLALRVCQPIARYWYAEMLRARQDLDRACVLFDKAQAMFESLGMPVYARLTSGKRAALNP